MSEWNGKRVLVTGAGGFIGSHLVERLCSEGARVRAFVHYNSRSAWGNLEYLPREVLGQVGIIPGDLADPFAVEKAVAGQEIVFHLGALIAIPYSYDSPAQFVATNVLGTLNVLEACRKCRVAKVVHTSTSEVYGTALYTPIDEKHPQQAQSPYSATKIGADRLAESYYRSFDLPVATIRPFNTYGPRQSARAVIPTIVTQALSGDQVLLGSVDPVRDLTFVEDTVEGFLAVATSERNGGEVINVGAGKGIRIGDLAGLIMDILGKRDFPIRSDEKRLRPEKSEVFEFVCDNRKALDLCGWRPRYTLREGLGKTILWIEAHLNAFKPGIYTI